MKNTIKTKKNMNAHMNNEPYRNFMCPTGMIPLFYDIQTKDRR